MLRVQELGSFNVHFLQPLVIKITLDLLSSPYYVNINVHTQHTYVICTNYSYVENIKKKNRRLNVVARRNRVKAINLEYFLYERINTEYLKNKDVCHTKMEIRFLPLCTR